MHKNQIEELANLSPSEPKLKLETLDASYNRITAIGRASLPHSVRSLSLSDNLISVIDPNTFVEKSNLSRVDLYGNQLVTLNLNALRLSPNVDALPEFYLGGNPFQCDCDMGNIPQPHVLLNLDYHLMNPVINRSTSPFIGSLHQVLNGLQVVPAILRCELLKYVALVECWMMCF